MIGPKTSATAGSTAVGGSNTGTLVNVTAEGNARVDVTVDSATVARRLPSHLSAVISQFAMQASALMSDTPVQELKPGIQAKLTFNNLSAQHRLIQDWFRYSHLLHRSYQGVEQVNQAARLLVKRRAGVVYDEELLRIGTENGIPDHQQPNFARQHAPLLVTAVIGRLMQDYSCSAVADVEVEAAHLAISLIVADAVIECEVLERPGHAVTA
jgi:hypothetical protein